MKVELEQRIGNWGPTFATMGKNVPMGNTIQRNFQVLKETRRVFVGTMDGQSGCNLVTSTSDETLDGIMELEREHKELVDKEKGEQTERAAADDRAGHQARQAAMMSSTFRNQQGHAPVHNDEDADGGDACTQGPDEFAKEAAVAKELGGFSPEDLEFIYTEGRQVFNRSLAGMDREQGERAGRVSPPGGGRGTNGNARGGGGGRGRGNKKSNGGGGWRSPVSQTSSGKRAKASYAQRGGKHNHASSTASLENHLGALAASLSSRQEATAAHQAALREEREETRAQEARREDRREEAARVARDEQRARDDRKDDQIMKMLQLFTAQAGKPPGGGP